MIRKTKTYFTIIRPIQFMGRAAVFFLISFVGLMPSQAAGLPPVAISDSYRTGMNTTLVVGSGNSLLLNDSDPDEDIISVIGFDTLPEVGAIGSPTASGTFDYTPPEDFQGVVSFIYRIRDGNSPENDLTATASVTIVVGEDPNRPPTAVPDRYFVAENTTLTVDAPGVLSNDYDIDGDTVSATQFINAQNGQVTFFSDGSFAYLPPTDFTGIDVFYYRVKDGEDAISNYTTVTLVVGIPLGTELLTNSGFETPGAAAKDAAGWKLIGTKKLGEKRICNNPITQKFYAQQGHCAYRFVGQETDQATLEQKVANPFVDALVANDTLKLNAYVERTNTKGGGTIKVIVDYVNTQLPSTAKSKGITVGTGDYIVFSTPTLTLTDVPRRVRVRISYKGKSGSFLVDSVSLVKNGGAVPLANLVIMPPAPDAIWQQAAPAQ